MREQFQGKLLALGEQLGGMCAMATAQLRMATRALLEADVDLAREVIAEDAALDVARGRCEQEAQSILALQAPVAGDLRTVLAVVYCADKVERMGDLARHIVEIVCHAHPQPAVVDAYTGLVAELGAHAVGIAERLQHLVTTPDETGFDELNAADRRVDELHEQLMRHITAEDWPHGIPAALNLALLARFYERFADQAVSVGRRLDFAVTGRLPGATRTPHHSAGDGEERVSL
jgi:phosphate transport system protein